MSFRRDIRECQKYADACARIAARAADAKTRDDFLRLKQSWLSLARCLALVPRMSSFGAPRIESQPSANDIGAIIE
jgi:hypothetical protein